MNSAANPGTRPILTREEDEVYIELYRYVRSVNRTHKKAFHLLCKSQPATFVDRNAVQRAFPSNNYGDSILEGQILFAVVNSDQNGRLCLAVITKASRFHQKVEEVLRKASVPTLIVESGVSGERPRIIEFIEKSLSGVKELAVPQSSVARKESTILKEVTNPYEALLLRLTNQILGRIDGLPPLLQDIYDRPNNPRLFHEVPLDAFLASDGWIPSEDQKFARRTRVDLLVTGPGPELTPLLVLEIDGKEHDKDLMQKKDRIKNKLLAAASVPLIRLQVKEFPVTRKGEAVVMKDWAESRRFKNLIITLLEEFIGTSRHQRVTVPARWKPYEMRVEQLKESFNSTYEFENAEIAFIRQCLEEGKEIPEDLGALVDELELHHGPVQPHSIWDERVERPFHGRVTDEEASAIPGRRVLHILEKYVLARRQSIRDDELAMRLCAEVDADAYRDESQDPEPWLSELEKFDAKLEINRAELDDGWYSGNGIILFRGESINIQAPRIKFDGRGFPNADTHARNSIRSWIGWTAIEYVERSQEAASASGGVVPFPPRAGGKSAI